MAPAKKDPMKEIRKQVAALQRARVPARTGSAFHMLAEKNKEYEQGVSDRSSDDYAKPTRERERPPKPNKVVKPKPGIVRKPAITIIELWRPAGGENPEMKCKAKAPEEITDTLGLARVSTWRLEAFQLAVTKLINVHGASEAITANELVHGGESVTDVFVRFRSELVAEMVKGKIDGVMVEGRKLQVTFA